MANTRVTRTQIQSVGEGDANVRLTRGATYGIGAGTASRATRIQLWAIGPHIPPDFDDSVSVSDSTIVQIIVPALNQIQDLVSNPLATQTVPMLGFVDLETQLADTLRQKMYLFLLDVLRQEDQDRGGLFLKRFVEGEEGDAGPQNVWDTIHATIRSIPRLWDVNNVPEEFLPYLRRIVGWTSDIEDIPLSLEGNALRRLLANSVSFWKSRGPDDAILDIINQATDGARARILDWFDFRVIMDESEMAYIVQGTDPHMISDGDESRYNIRVVDDGTLNRDLLKRVIGITRPINERVDISYLRFLDLFTVDGDESQWNDDSGILSVASGLATITGLGEVYAIVNGAEDWTNYTFTFVAHFNETSAGSNGSGATFYRTGPGDFYHVYVIGDSTPASDYNHLKLDRHVGGAPTNLADVDLSDFGMLVDFGSADLEFGIQVTVTSSNVIKVYVDNVKVVEVTDTSHAHGTIGFKTLSALDTLRLREVELFFNPMESDTVDINS